jgi:D-alanyl-D-alanine carboxypeptidase
VEEDLDEIEPWGFPISKEIMRDEGGLLILVNDHNVLDERWRPTDTVYAKVRITGADSILIRRDVGAALTQMFKAAEDDGLWLYLSSGYRDYAKQRANYYNGIQRIGYDDNSIQQAGASEHQTGLCADVINREWIGSHLKAEFAETEHGQWLAAHCAEYGFVIRYPKGKEDITGITYEPWHVRYVGVEVAEFMTRNGITLEEFWEWWEVYLEER